MCILIIYHVSLIYIVYLKYILGILDIYWLSWAQMTICQKFPPLDAAEPLLQSLDPYSLRYS